MSYGHLHLYFFMLWNLMQRIRNACQKYAYHVSKKNSKKSNFFVLSFSPLLHCGLGCTLELQKVKVLLQ